MTFSDYNVRYTEMAPPAREPFAPNKAPMTFEEEQQKKLTDDLRRQLREEIGDDELSKEAVLALQHKFGLTTVPLKPAPVRPMKRDSL